jgi:hypothetical protein
MNVKNLMTIIVAALLFGNAAFGQTVQVAGNVSALTDAQITMTLAKDTWLIKRVSTTTVVTGTLAVGNMVTVQCLSGDVQKVVGGDAQKKE